MTDQDITWWIDMVIDIVFWCWVLFIAYIGGSGIRCFLQLRKVEDRLRNLRK